MVRRFEIHFTILETVGLQGGDRFADMVVKGSSALHQIRKYANEAAHYHFRNAVKVCSLDSHSCRAVASVA